MREIFVTIGNLNDIFMLQTCLNHRLRKIFFACTEILHFEKCSLVHGHNYNLFHEVSIPLYASMSYVIKLCENIKSFLHDCQVYDCPVWSLINRVGTSFT